MNHFQLSTTSKRVSGQYHLALCKEGKYRGLPIYVHPQGLVSDYLERLLGVINSIATKHTKIFAVRVDLHFPQSYSCLEELALANNYLQVFIKKLRYKLERYKNEKHQLGERVHDVGFEYAWAREEGPDSGKPHFHVLLLFNGHAFRGLGNFSGGENLCSRLGESWADALGLHAAEGVKYMHFPENGQYLIDPKNQTQLGQVFYRASYFTKVATKNFHGGFHVFGSSRV